eukprot:6181030-Pleurochrysis_carterae.AAC.1
MPHEGGCVRDVIRIDGSSGVHARCEANARSQVRSAAIHAHTIMDGETACSSQRKQRRNAVHHVRAMSVQAGLDRKRTLKKLLYIRYVSGHTSDTRRQQCSTSSATKVPLRFDSVQRRVGMMLLRSLPRGTAAAAAAATRASAARALPLHAARSCYHTRGQYSSHAGIEPWYGQQCSATTILSVRKDDKVQRLPSSSLQHSAPSPFMLVASRVPVFCPARETGAHCAPAALRALCACPVS